MSHETIEELTKRRDLLKEIAELSTNMPSEDEMEALDGYVSNIAALENLDAKIPSDDEMEALAQHVSNFVALLNFEDDDYPSDDEMEALAQHVANLKVMADTAAG